MALELVSEIWNELKSHISTVDRAEAAETVVNILIENGFDGAEIRDLFKGDSHIKNALSEYPDEETQEEDDEDEDGFYFEDEDEDY